jgi:hypothetical protein
MKEDQKPMKESKKSKTRWLLVIGIVLLFPVWWWVPKLMSLFSPTAPALSSGPKVANGQRHVEPEGPFSFIPPEGWEMRSIPQSKFKAAIGPPAGGFSPNIVVLDELWPGSLDDYIKAAIESWGQKKPNIKVVKREDFATAEGLEGRRLILENRGDNALRQRMYIFPKGETKYVVTCTTVAEGADKLVPVFEDCIKTFRFEEPEK